MLAAIARHFLAVHALVEVEPGLLTGSQIDSIGQTVLDDFNRFCRNKTDRRVLAGAKSFLGRDPTLGPDLHALGAALIQEGFQDHVAPCMKREARELRDKPAIVTINRQPREAVAFTEDQPVASTITRESQLHCAKADRAAPVAPTRSRRRAVDFPTSKDAHGSRSSG